MNDKIVKVNAAEYGIEETKAAEIEAFFAPMLAKMKELETEYNEIVDDSIEIEIDNDLCVKAKALRLKYVKVRTGTAAIHKGQKAYYLAAGRFVDGWKNAQLFAAQGNEARLKAIEDHFVNMKKEREARQQKARVAELAKYEFDASAMALGEMSPVVWEALQDTTKRGYEARIEAERKAEDERKAAAEKAEQERLAKKKADAEAREKQRLENERLKKEAAEAEARAKAERAEAEQKLAAERKLADEKEAKAKKEAAAAAKKLAAEKKKQAEAEARAKALKKKLESMITCPECGYEFERETINA